MNVSLSLLQILLIDARLRSLSKFSNSKESVVCQSKQVKPAESSRHNRGVGRHGAQTPQTTPYNFDTKCLESLDPVVEGSPVVKVLQLGHRVVFLEAQWSSHGDCFVVAQKDGCVSIFTANGLLGM